MKFARFRIMLVVLAIGLFAPQANALLCTAQACKYDGSGCKPFFGFVKDKPTKTVSGTVAKLKSCDPDPKLIISNDPVEYDDCIGALFTYVNRETGKIEQMYYKNGATSSDGKTWEGVQNPSCPAIP